MHVWWVPCHHGIVRPPYTDGGEGLQIWRAAANTLNKQWRRADKGFHKESTLLFDKLSDYQLFKEYSATWSE
jgi:hypothetical protein